MLPIDVSKAFRFHRELLSLVNAVLAAGSTDEARWIEWKGTLDLSTPAAQHHLVKQILAFSNRDPVIAARWAEGYAYVVIGAEAQVQHPVGVTPIDAAVLEAQIFKWVPKEITWNIDYVNTLGRDVLVIAIDPPVTGDPIWTLQKPIGNFPAGTIFVRNQASVDQAGPADIKMLQERYAAGRNRTRLTVAPAALNIEPRPDVATYIRQHCDDVEEGLKACLEEPQDGSMGTTYRVAVPNIFKIATEPDPRSRDQYIAEVDKYIEVLASAMADRADYLLPRRAINEIQLSMQNLTEHMLESVELIAVFAGRAQSAVLGLDRHDAMPALPKRPKTYGPRVKTELTTGFDRGLLGSLSQLSDARRWAATTSAIDRINVLTRPPRRFRSLGTPEGLEIRFNAFDLRPEQAYSLPPVGLDVFEPEGSIIDLRWSATSSRHPGVARGVIPVTLTPSTFDLSLLHTDQARERSE